MCKNLYGLINSNTLFRVLDGAWTAETDEEHAKHNHGDLHIGETYLEMLLARLRGHQATDALSSVSCCARLTQFVLPARQEAAEAMEERGEEEETITPDSRGDTTTTMTPGPDPHL